MKKVGGLIVAATCLLAGVAPGVVTVTPEAKWSYSGDTPGVFTEAFTNAVASGSSVGVVYDVATDATISGNMTSDHGGFVKLGPGTLTFAGANNLSAALGTSYSFGNQQFSRFTLDETGNHATTGFSEFNILDGKLVVTNKTTTTKQTYAYAIMGGYTADIGEVEKDVTIEIRKGGKIQQNVRSALGMRHGFVNNTAPGKPALALLRIYPGGTYSQGGGKEFYFGGNQDNPSTATWGAFNSDIRIEVLGGTFTAGNSYAGFLVAQYNGQRSTIIVKDGGVFQDYYIRTGRYSSAGSVAPLEIDVSGAGSEFRVQSFDNNANAKSGPTTTLRVRDGATFKCDQMDTYNNGVIDIFLDDATVSTYAILNTHVATDRKVVFPAGVTSLTLGAGGATLISTGTATNPASNKVQLPITAVFAKGFASSPDLPAGTPDGGLVIKGGTSANVIELAGASTYVGPTLLQSGTLTLSGDGALPAGSAFTQVGGTLFANTKDITLGDATFGIGATIKLATGRRLIVNGDLSMSVGTLLTFLDANGDEIAEPFDSKPFITVPAAHASALENVLLPNRTSSGLRLSSKSVTLDPGGETATLYVSFAAVAADSADVWTGEAANTLATQADNWKSGSAPSLVNGSLLATFAEGGDTAAFAGVADLRGVAFEGTSFNLEGAGNSSLLLGSGGISFAAPEGGATPTYTIGLPFASRDSQNITVPSGVSLAFTNSVEMSAPVAVSGAGGISFTGETSTFGNLMVASSTKLSLSGRIRNVDGMVYGAPSSGVEDSAMQFYGSPDSNDRNVLSNVVIEKSVNIKDGLMGGRAFRVAAGSTCTFKGGVHMTIPWKYINLGSGAECVFENGASLDWTVKINGTGRCVVRNKPISCGANFTLDKATLRMECSGNSCSIAMFVEDAGRLELAAPNAFTKTALNLANEASTVDLCGTSQQFKYVLCSGAKPTITGAPGSVLEVTQGAPANASVIGITNINCKIEGSVGISMTGAGLLRLKSQQFASAGDVSVSNGTLEFASDASWLNGTNVTVSGSGTLRIGSATTFNSEFVVIHFADDGKIAVPSGMTQTFAEGWDGDRRLKPGALYTSANLPAHVAPGGSIHIAGGGMMLIFR